MASTSNPSTAAPKTLLKRFWGLGLIAILMIPVIIQIVLDERTFQAMKPAEHVAAANKALAQDRLDDAQRHIDALRDGSVIVSASEAASASEVRDQVEAKREMARQEAAGAKQANESRGSAIRSLQETLRNLGYDLTVGASRAPDEIVITSSDFGDTDRRVKFLAFLRGPSNPQSNMCSLGFRTVRLKNGWMFSEAYSLDCF